MMSNNVFLTQINLDSYECYYCDYFTPTDDKDDYEKHVVLFHDGKLAYPSLADLEKTI